MIHYQFKRSGNASLLVLAIHLTGHQLVIGGGSFGESHSYGQSPLETKPPASSSNLSSTITKEEPNRLKGLEYEFIPSRPLAHQSKQTFETHVRNDTEYSYPDHEKSFSLPPIPNRRRRGIQEARHGGRATFGVISRIGLTPLKVIGYQQTDIKSTDEASPYDDVFLAPPASSISKDSSAAKVPRANQTEASDLQSNDDDALLTLPQKQFVSPFASPSDTSQIDNNAEVEELSTNDLNLLEGDRRNVAPYQPPNLKSQSEKVVPLPVVPAPTDFPGYLPVGPNASKLPEPSRRFDLPKQQVVIPNQPEYRDQSSQAMPWHSDEMYQEYGMQSLSESGGRGPIPYEMAGQQRDPVEEHSKRAPLSTLPERLHSRHYHFQILPYMPSSSSPLPLMSDAACHVELQYSDFAPNPQVPKPLNACNEIETYYGKSMVETQRPWVEWWRPFYTGGMYEPGVPVFSDVNLLTPSFLVYGDYRTAVGVHRFGGKPSRQWAHRLNLDMDLRLTGTERFHMFTGPLDHNGRFTRLDFSDSDDVEFEEELDFRPDTAFFEGDLGAITGSWTGTDAPFDLPFTMGIVPLLYQNGIWMEDAIVGFAVGSPWRHSRPFNWENFESTFFAGFADINSPAFQDQNAAKVFGTAWFIEAYGGYIEADYAYLDERQDLGRSYHNAALAYTRRYMGRISNSIRFIGNAGQRGPAIDRTADGVLLLVENSLITSQPSHFVPYFNGFVGNGRPQSVARAGGSGEILRNTGINFESDGLTAYPTLNATGANSFGGAIGVNFLSADFRQQFVAEFTALDRYGNPALSGLAGPQYAIGARYQKTLNNRALIRFDAMNGWLDNASNIYGMRSEFRWKF